MLKVSTHEAKTHLSRLLSKVAEGEEVCILRGREPAARLVPVAAPRHRAHKRPVGIPSSPPVKYAPDAFEPLTPEEMERMGFA